jgi:uncharacterized protein YfdQ (DUF2303 family)
MDQEKGTAEVVAKLARELAEVNTLPIVRGSSDSAYVLTIPSGRTVTSVKKLLDEYLPAPERREGTATLFDVASFVEHVKRFADVDSVVFADPTPASAKLTAVIDYHRAGADADPRFGRHRAVYSFPLSDEWRAWTAKDVGGGMAQKDFAEFVENRIADVMSPEKAGQAARALSETIGASFATPAQLMALSRGLAVTIGRRVKNAVNLSTGEVEVSFVEEHADSTGKPLKVPGAILLSIPVFRGEDHYQVPARLRYRVTGEGLRWSVDLYRTDVIFRDAFMGACATVKEATGLPLLLGSPEA